MLERTWNIAGYTVVFTRDKWGSDLSVSRCGEDIGGLTGQYDSALDMFNEWYESEGER